MRYQTISKEQFHGTEHFVVDTSRDQMSLNYFVLRCDTRDDAEKHCKTLNTALAVFREGAGKAFAAGVGR